VPADETVLESPVLTGSLDSLSGDLEAILADQGLHPDEAHAMVQTWRDSWFEEGSRLIYIVPADSSTRFCRSPLIPYLHKLSACLLAELKS
jgi:hypothetical protein